MTPTVQAAFDGLYRRRYDFRHIARTALNGVPGVPVDDVLDEAFVRLWAEIADLDTDEMDETLRRHINVVGRTLSRRQEREMEREMPVGLLFDLEEVAADSAPDGASDPTFLTIERLQFREAFDAALRELPPKQREAFILAELRGATQREIAELLGIRQQSVAERVENARESIRNYLTERGAV